jgi:hypothetical protein
MFWNWSTAVQRRDLTVRAERVIEILRRALEHGRLRNAPRDVVDEVVATTVKLASIAPKDLDTTVSNAERLAERVLPYLEDR